MEKDKKQKDEKEDEEEIIRVDKLSTAEKKDIEQNILKIFGLEKQPNIAQAKLKKARFASSFMLRIYREILNEKQLKKYKKNKKIKVKTKKKKKKKKKRNINLNRPSLSLTNHAYRPPVQHLASKSSDEDVNGDESGEDEDEDADGSGDDDGDDDDDDDDRKEGGDQDFWKALDNADVIQCYMDHGWCSYILHLC